MVFELKSDPVSLGQFQNYQNTNQNFINIRMKEENRNSANRKHIYIASR